jgi:MFS superfamily sulfate permease-like transporter
MGIAMASGMPAAVVTGVIGGLVVGSVAGSPLQVSGPPANLEVIVFGLIGEHGLKALGSILILAGAIQLTAGLLKIGPLVPGDFVGGDPWNAGGIGLLIVIQQFHVVLDRSPEHSGPANCSDVGAVGGLLPLDGSKDEAAALIAW